MSARGRKTKDQSINQSANDQGIRLRSVSLLSIKCILNLYYCFTYKRYARISSLVEKKCKLGYEEKQTKEWSTQI